MGQIQSSVGLITGIPILDTVDQLIAVSAQPRDLIVGRNAALRTQQVAVSQLLSRVLGIQFASSSLGRSELFEDRAVSSSDTATLSASIPDGQTPVAGSYQFTPVQTAQAHQLLSSEFSALDEPIGAGSFTLQFGGFIDQGVSLDTLGGGQGVERGQIRITDRSGDSAIIDLRYARTVDDVLTAVNNTTEVNVSIEAIGDRFQLTDHTGGSGNLTVQEVGAGTTAANLGLAAIDVAADQANGQVVLTLGDRIRLDQLNDGGGVGLREGLADLSVDLADGTNLQIDFLADANNRETTLGDLVATINQVDPAKLEARIAADGTRLELVDLTSGGGAFQATSLLGGTVAEDLGLDNAAQAGVISGNRLLGGLDSVLLSTLSGGQGVGPLGTVEITDRSGTANLNVDLSSAETLDEVVELINAAGVGVEATINSARNGLTVRDTSGGSGNLIIANGDGTNSADALGIAVNDTVDQAESGSLDRQTVSRQTRLASLNNGQGVDLGSFIITDSSGAEDAVQLDAVGAELETVGQVIDAINDLPLGVTARINDTGDGIVLEDTAGGSEALTVREVGTGTTAADLQLLGTAVDVNGTPTIDGSARVQIDISSEDTLADVIQRINDLGLPVSASTFSTGTGFRLSLTAEQTGTDFELLLDTSGVDFEFSETSAARDALLLFGSPENAAAGVLVASSDNEFEGIIDGLDLSVVGPAETPVTITVSESNQALANAIEDLVSDYNSLRDDLDTLTAFDESTGVTAVLFGSREALRVETDLTNLLTGRFSGVGQFQSLEAVGIEIDENGRLSLDRARLDEAFAENPDDLERLFTDDELGVAAKLEEVANQLAGTDNSVLSARNQTLVDRIDSNQDRIDLLNARLEIERQRLLNQFFQAEQVIARLQNNLSALNQLQTIEPGSISFGL